MGEEKLPEKEDLVRQARGDFNAWISFSKLFHKLKIKII